MGLDMYLTGKKYIKDWGFNHPDGVIPENTPAKICQKAVGLDFPVTRIEVELGYWRKANHIHHWFVNYVQGGVDDCGVYDVSAEQLEELLARVETVLADPSQASELLPTQHGFFFGGTEYDEYYLKDLEYTRDVISSLKTSHALEQLDIYYQSSW